MVGIARDLSLGFHCFLRRHNCEYSLAIYPNGIKSKHIKMADMLVPVSMAMITIYDPEYLGIEVPEKELAAKGKDND